MNEPVRRSGGALKSCAPLRWTKYARGLGLYRKDDAEARDRWHERLRTALGVRPLTFWERQHHNGA